MNSGEMELKIRKIVEEIVSRFMNKRLLVVFTGGMGGFADALHEIKMAVSDNDLNCDILFSKSAAEIHDVASISKELNAAGIIVEGKDRIKSFKDFLTSYNLVVVGVLTRNTAAKAARLFLDTYASQLIIDSLMMGIPVLSALDAADPRLEAWEKLGFIWTNGALKTALEENISILSGYGVKFCRAKELCGAITSLLYGKPRQNFLYGMKSESIRIERKVITRGDIMPHAGEGCRISIPKGAVITPLALDAIRENNLQVIRE
ncbi:MAG: hypothetical protein NUV45_12395 [Tepidanaerobacteraceae bacterium]|jgi:hypothetical protein|nr:hypothetical protein [Tepidanaerobacteraceae bacterium]